MAKRRSKGKRQKRTKSDKRVRTFQRLGPRGLSKDPVAIAEAARQKLAEDFETRKKAQIAKAAIELDQVDGAILQLVLTHPSITQEQVGEVVGLTRQTVNERMNAAKFKRAIQIATRSALEVFEGNKARAARVLGELLGSPDDRIKIRAAVAHMWPEIHKGESKSGEDFVSFIQEAFERAQSPDKAASE